MSFWMDNATSAMGQQPDRATYAHTLVDCGYVQHPVARRNADRLFKLVSKSNAEVVYAGRLLVRIPPAKVAAVLTKFPQIKPIQRYAWCSHSFGDGPQFELAARTAQGRREQRQKGRP